MADSDKVSGRFSASDSDVTFRSCDRILFQVHRNNLKVVSEGFAPPDGTGTSQREIVPLTESGETLELLFQFIYPHKYPDLKDVEFTQLAKLAEAAEKYQVYSAMAVCNFKMRDAYQEHPHEVMMYAMTHGYADLMDKSERTALDVSQTVAFECFSLQVYIAWTRYYFQWADLLANLTRSLDGIPLSSNSTDEVLPAVQITYGEVERWDNERANPKDEEAQ
ncbi:hypothetical protein FIBSPDRAFT_885213 [Athelia psychrophila]|uniref:BTB domain-containing protein n=1 Tax=Athelia psychrophila TaxID=1759441 RepID=A0A166S7Y5_9AGAM|nr:hypothetical protein FIBSPDRAFT_885213 [Fibularhizoctonia sp. CBS 109695]